MAAARLTGWEDAPVIRSVVGAVGLVGGFLAPAVCGVGTMTGAVSDNAILVVLPVALLVIVLALVLPRSR